MSPQDKTSSPLDAFLKQQQQLQHEDCDRPACKDTADAISAALDRLKKTTTTKTSNGNSTSASTRTKEQIAAKECPPSKGMIGDATWTFLHSMVSIDVYMCVCVCV